MSAPGLVVFGEDWGAHPSSTQHLIARLAQRRDVVWINSIGLRRPRLSQHDLRRLSGKLWDMTRRRSPQAQDGRIPPRLRLMNPRAVSWPGSKLAAAFNRASLGAQVRAQMASADMTRPILWTSLPSAVVVADSIPHRALVYYCGDDFSALAGVPVLRIFSVPRCRGVSGKFFPPAGAA